MNLNTTPPTNFSEIGRTGGVIPDTREGQIESTLDFDLLAPSPFTDGEIEQMYQQDLANDARRGYAEETI